MDLSWVNLTINRLQERAHLARLSPGNARKEQDCLESGRRQSRVTDSDNETGTMGRTKLVSRAWDDCVTRNHHRCWRDSFREVCFRMEAQKTDVKAIVFAQMVVIFGTTIIEKSRVPWNIERTMLGFVWTLRENYSSHPGWRNGSVVSYRETYYILRRNIVHDCNTRLNYWLLAGRLRGKLSV